MKILSLDLETILDAEAGRRAYRIAGTDAEVMAQMRALRLAETDGRTDFCKAAFHQIVAVGLVGIDTALGKVKLNADAGRGERALLALIQVWLERKPAPLVTWGGSNFDLAVLRYRALLHGIPLTGLYGPENQKRYDSYLYRYSDTHFDLMELLSGFGASTPLRLVEAARLCGLPAKTITDGSGVEELVAAGEWPALKSYVLEDALDTALLFLRFELSRGRFARPALTELLVKINDELSMDHIDVSTAIQAWLAELRFAPAPAPAQEPELSLGVA